MRARRTLALRRETLTELDTADMTVVVGAGQVLPTTPLQCVVSLALTGCGTSVNPKCPGADA